MIADVELEKWFAYLKKLDGVDTILNDLGVDECSELSLLEFFICDAGWLRLPEAAG